MKEAFAEKASAADDENFHGKRISWSLIEKKSVYRGENGVVDGFKANHPITFYLTHQNSNL